MAGPSDAGSPNFDATQAEAAWRAGDWRGALDLYLALLNRWLTGRDPDAPLPPAGLVALERTADLAVPFREFDGADRLLAAIAGYQAEAGRFLAADYATLKRAHLALEAGSLEATSVRLTALKAGLGPVDCVPDDAARLPRWEHGRWPDLPPEGRSLLLTRAYHVMGRWFAVRGRYRQAATLLGRGRELIGPGAPPLVAVAREPLGLALASVKLEQGYLADTASLLAELDGKLDPRRQPGPYAAWLETSVKLDLLRGNFGPALRRSGEAAHLCLERGFRRAAVDALLNHAQILIVFNQVGFAEEVLADALAAWRPGDGPRARLRAVWLARLARARAATPAGVAELAPSVNELWRGRPGTDPPPAADAGDPDELPPAESFLALFEDRALAVVWALACGNLREAGARLGGLTAAFGGSESDLIRVRTAVLAGTVAYETGDYVAADAALRRGAVELERLGLRPELWQVLRQLGWCAGRLGRPTAECHALDRRAADLLRELAATFDPVDRAIYLLNKWTTEERALAVEIEDLAARKRAAAAAAWYRRPWLRWQLAARVRRLLVRLDDHRRTLSGKALGKEVRRPADSRPPGRWLREWPWRRLTVPFLVLPDRVFAARTGWFDVDFCVAGLSRVRLRELVAGLHRAVDAEQQSARDKADGLATALGLPELLRRLPRRVRALTFIPDDALHGLPFAALTLGGRFLIEDRCVSVDFGCAPDSPAGTAPNAPALALAVSHGNVHFQTLKGARAEADLVSSWLAERGLNPVRLADANAGRGAVLAAWSRSGFVHAACHGRFVLDRPDSSGLVLIPRDGEGEEMLTLVDLAALDLGRLRHVTLSSCWGADSFVLPGRYPISLPQTLCQAGAASVLGCLWPVDDDVNPAFMRQFYGHLTKWPRDEALRRTQLDCLRGALKLPKGRGADQPFYWAGFQLYGSTGRLKPGRRQRAARPAPALTK